MLYRNGNTPCYHCEYREVNCHSRCGAYQSWKIEDLERSLKEKKERNKYFECVDIQIQAIVRENKRKRK